MISRHTGERLEYIEQIKQSIGDILTTPIGSRVMRREYGSILPELIDRPIDDVLILQCYSAIYSALYQWEDRIIIDNIGIEQVAHGRLQIMLDAALAQTGEQMSLNVDISLGGAL